LVPSTSATDWKKDKGGAMDYKQAWRNAQSNFNRRDKEMNIRFGISRNTVYLLPTLSVGTDDVMDKRVYWINLAFLSFDILIIFGV
jgi:hypothetical protein